jgi:hypothetical protein
MISASLSRNSENVTAHSGIILKFGSRDMGLSRALARSRGASEDWRYHGRPRRSNAWATGYGKRCAGT